MKNNMHFFIFLNTLVVLSLLIGLAASPAPARAVAPQPTPTKQTTILRSQASYDGWIREKSEKSGIGWRLNFTNKRFNVGDDDHNRQMRGFLSFDTSGIPDNAVVTSVTLKVKKARMVGSNPFKTHGKLRIDIQNGYLGTSPELQLGDFQAAPSAKKVGVLKKIKGSKWYQAKLNENAYAYVNKTGLTQFRLRFAKQDDNDNSRDFVKFFSGDSWPDTQPQLIIEYATSNLEVTKVVDWGSTTPDGSQTFEICISGPSYPGGDCKTTDYDGGALTWLELGPGEYTATETDPGGLWTVSGSGQVVVVASGQTATATVTNTRDDLGCTYTNGYWSANPGAWPVTSLTLGTRDYNQTELLSILDQPVVGNGLISLAHELIAAKLNAANGAFVPTGVATAIADADTLIDGLVVPPVGSGYLASSATAALTTILNNYNFGSSSGGPPSCIN